MSAYGNSSEMLADHNTNKDLLYSPTSPVSEGGDLPSNVQPTPADEFRNDDRTEEAHFFKLHETEPARLGLGGSRDITPCPDLLVGSKYSKVVPLRPGRWVGMGRSKKCQLLLNNGGVSRNHCDIRWDQYRRIVELRDTSNQGTWVNGQTIKNSRLILAHADHISIEGKDIHYNFLLDMRPVKLGFSDPREELRANQSLKKASTSGPWQRRNSLRAQILHVDATIKSCEEQAFQKEKEFYEIATRRRLRLFEDKQKEEQYQQYLRGTEELHAQLQQGREDWLERLQMEYEKNEKDINVIIEETKVLQEKVEKLQLKKDELERSIHPEKYAVADVSCSGSNALEGVTATGSDTRSLQDSRNLSATQSADGEEGAFSQDDAGLDNLIPVKGAEEHAVADVSAKGEEHGQARPAPDVDEADDMNVKRRKLEDE